MIFCVRLPSHAVVTVQSLLLLGAMGLAGCMNAAKYRGDSNLASPEELARHDPAPDQENEGPAFCDPRGKTGADLQRCHEQNEAFYQEFDAEAKKREPWFNFPPDSWASSPAVERQFVVPVVKVAEAVEKLESVPFVELTPADVSSLTGKTPSFAGRKAFLVRGLLYFAATGRFAVFYKDQSILVYHESIGAEMPAESRAPVVAFLPFTPKDVFVDCSLAD